MKLEFRELIELYLQDSCTEKQLEQILELVTEDDNFRAELAEAGRIQGLLNAVNYDKYEGLSQRVLRSAGDMDESSLEEKILQSLELTGARTEKKTLKFNAVFWTAIAAQIAIIFVLFGMNKPDEENSSLASLYSESGQAYVIRNGKELPVTAALRLRNGDSIRVVEKGDVSITWNDSTILQFKDKSEASFSMENGAKKVDFKRGKLQAKVTKQPEGKALVINTPNSIATVLGTKFQLKVNKLETMLEVSRGAVGLKRKANGKSVVVKAHQYAVSSPTQPLTVNKMDIAVYRSHEINLDTPERKVEIVAEINGSRKLYLVVHNGRDGIAFDHAAWLKPRLEDTLGREFSLLELEWKFADSEWGVMGVGVDALGNPLTHNGEIKGRGIGTHALSVIEYDIPEGYRLFKSTGIISDSGSTQNRSLSSVVFEVYTEFPEQRYKRIKLSSEGK